MIYRISAGALVVKDGRILLVRHRREGVHDFWVAPGGGVEGSETLEEAAARETMEETGLQVRAQRLAYHEELWSETSRTAKFWFLAEQVGGVIDISRNPAQGESIVDARWFPIHALPTQPVFPEPLRAGFAEHLATRFLAPIRLPLRKLLF